MDKGSLQKQIESLRYQLRVEKVPLSKTLQDSYLTNNNIKGFTIKNLEKTRSASAKKSCTIYLNGKGWCTHDGVWYGCSEGYDEKSLIKAICSRYNGPNKPIECNTAM
ncbi:unnamed protein product [Rotaria sordida]|uniref:Uncharacterized protein n=1 Tax=Rotaria sordida TaxID=392033 RepID=A0A818JG79_9BILA|nr:unnamed protein product [Rotaria sordida]